jgi:hypothetical protein
MPSAVKVLVVRMSDGILFDEIHVANASHESIEALLSRNPSARWVDRGRPFSAWSVSSHEVRQLLLGWYGEDTDELNELAPYMSDSFALTLAVGGLD